VEGEGERGAVCGNTHVDDVEARDKEAGKHTLRLGEAEAPDYHTPAARTRHTRSATADSTSRPTWTCTRHTLTPPTGGTMFDV
jgi:hypothetical protein